MKQKPTIEEIEKLLSGEDTMNIEILPSGEIKAVNPAIKKMKDRIIKKMEGEKFNDHLIRDTVFHDDAIDKCIRIVNEEGGEK